MTKTSSWCKYIIPHGILYITDTNSPYFVPSFRWHKVQVTDTTYEVMNLPTAHEIMFKVAATNCAGTGPTSHNTKYIKIASPGSFAPPVVQEPLSDLSIGMGKSAELHCVITGKPTPVIKW